MSRYLNNSIIIDTFLAFILIGLLSYFKEQVELRVMFPKEESIGNFISSLISVSATLVGFLLTIITIIVTFKESYTSGKKMEQVVEEKPKTVFDRVIKKEDQFYQSEMPERLGSVFTKSTYELAVILFLLIFIQSELIAIDLYYKTVIIGVLFLLILLTTLRSFVVFQSFLNVHLNR
ncbi:MAG: hypothetical protein JKY48_01315 [Flavobacteriales bacterium]|nr:hypothetical protein [Flavobacteriales bacterium]